MGRTDDTPEGSLQRRLEELQEENARLENQLEAVRDRATSFTALAENAASGLLIAFEPDRHVYANRRASEITGYSFAELTSMGPRELAHPDELPRLLENFRRRLAGEPVPERYETVLVHKDGHPLHVELAPTITVWHGRKANMILIRDLSETHRALLEAEQANRSLAESEERYRQLVEVSPYCITMSVAGRIEFINPAGVRLMGASSAEDLLGRRVLEFPLPAYREMVGRRIQEVTENGEPAPSVELQLNRLDGTPITVEVQSVPIVYRGEQGFQSVVRDITEERHIEDRQQRINSALRAVLGIADELMACRDTDSLHRRAVELARERLGLERCSLHLVNGSMMRGTYGTSLDGETTDERNHTYPGGDYWAEIRQILPGAPRWAVLDEPYREWSGEEMDILDGTEGGTVFTVVQAQEEPIGVFYNDYAISGRPIDAGLQEVVAVYCSLLGNILHRQRTEQALRQSEERFREMTDLLPDVVVETELDGTVLYANRTAFELTGYSAQDIAAGISMLELLSADQAEKARERMQFILQTGEPLTAQYYLRAKDDSVFPAEVRTIVRRDATGDPIGFRAVVRDITERVRVEEAQRLSAVGELAAAMAHEFGNILAGMRAWAQVFQRTGSQEAWDSLLSAVLRGSDRGGALCWNLLRLAHPPTPERQPINIESPIEAALSMAAPELEQHQVHVVRDYRTGPNGHAYAARVFVDPAQMEQVFLNLFINACHAMAAGGTLSIETTRAHGLRGDEVRVRVTDTGVGIPSENLPRIFEPFFTTKNESRNGGMAGHGLGLSVSYGIVHEHDGTLTVQSEAGVGTTFELRLAEYVGSTEAQTETTTEEAELPCVGGEGQRILVVDDDEALRSSIGFSLCAEGYEPVLAANTRQALEALEQWDFQLLITDLILPGGGGAEIMAAATALDDPVPVILMTGKAGEVLAQELLSWGAQKCFHKPFDLTELLDTIEQLLRPVRG